MSNYKLTEAEARALANEVAKTRNQISTQTFDFDKWAKDYMLTYNKIMSSLEQYTDTTSV